MANLIVNGRGDSKNVPTEEGFVINTENQPYEQKETTDWRDMLDEHIRRQEYRSEIDPATQYAKVETPTEDWVMVAVSGDKHIGCAGFDWAGFMRDSKLVMETPNCYEIDMGDIAENLFFNAHEQVFNLKEQVQIINSWAKEMLDRGKMICTVGGNHDNFLSKFGVEFQMLATGFGGFVPYLREGGYLEWKVGDVVYKFRLNHKTRYNSELNPHHTNHRTYWMVASDCDVIASAHSHSNTTEEWAVREPKGSRKVVFIKSGTYKLRDGYKDANGWIPDWQTGSPYLLLNPQQKSVYQGTGIEDGIRLLHALNGK